MHVATCLEFIAILERNHWQKSLWCTTLASSTYPVLNLVNQMGPWGTLQPTMHLNQLTSRDYSLEIETTEAYCITRYPFILYLYEMQSRLSSRINIWSLKWTNAMGAQKLGSKIVKYQLFVEVWKYS